MRATSDTRLTVCFSLQVRSSFVVNYLESSGLRGSRILLSLKQYLVEAARGDLKFIALLSLPLALGGEVQAQIELYLEKLHICLQLLRAGKVTRGQEKGRHC